METVKNSFTPNTYLSPIMENASCVSTRGGYSYYRPINTVNWDTNNITLRCANNIETSTDNAKKMDGSIGKNEWPSNAYLHSFFTNEYKISCDDGNNPILGMKWIEAGGNSGKYHPEYICPANDSIRFAQTKEYSYRAPNISAFNADLGATPMNKLFMEDAWLNKDQYVFKCPANWYLGKIQGGLSGLNNEYYNEYKWTCGTIYHEYVNDDGIKFEWRYYKKDDELMMEIITNIKLFGDEADVDMHDYIDDNGQYIDFIFVYNFTANKLSINIKNSNSNEYYDVTNDCYVRNTKSNIECNLPLTELSIVQFIFTKSNEDPVDMLDNGTIITDLPMFFKSIYMVQDTTLPKIYAVTYDTAATGGLCEGSTAYTKTYTEGEPISHPNCTRLGHTAGDFIDLISKSNIPNGTIVSSRMYIQPQFEAIKYTINFNNETSDFEYIQCEGDYTTTASLNEVISPAKIPSCDGEGVNFNGWMTPDKYKAGVDPIRGSMTYYPSVEYPDYTLTFNVPTGVSCRDCLAVKTINRTKPIGTLPVPAKTGYTFDGWYYDKEFTKKVSETDKLTKNTTVYPNFVTTRWSVNIIAPENAVVTPDVTMRYVDDGSTLGNTFPSAMLNGYTFSGWYQIDSNDNFVEKWTKTKPIYENIVLTAVFKDANGNQYYKKYSEASKNNELSGNTINNNTITNENINSVNSSTSNVTNNTTSNSVTSSSNGITNSGSVSIIPTHCNATGEWGKTSVNTVAEMNCPAGYTGRRTRFCKADGTWENVDSTSCQIVESGPTHCDADGVWDKTKVGVYVSIPCEDGEGEQSRLCQSDGTWSNPVGECKSTGSKSSLIIAIIVIVVIVIGLIVLYYMFIRKSGTGMRTNTTYNIM